MLLQMADLMVVQRSLPELLQKLESRLRKVVHYDFANFSFYDPSENLMRLCLWSEGESLGDPIELSVKESLSGSVWEEQQSRVCSDLKSLKKYPAINKIILRYGLQTYAAVPLSTARQRLGALGFGSSRAQAYSEDDLRFLEMIGQLVALTLENSQGQESLDREKRRLEALVQLSHALVSTIEIERLLPAISGSLRAVMRVDFASVALMDQEVGKLRIVARDFPVAGLDVGSVLPETFANTALHDRQIQIVPETELESGDSLRALYETGARSGCRIPLITTKGVLGTLNLASRSVNAFTASDVDFLTEAAAHIALAMDNARAYGEIAQLKEKLSEEKLYLEDEIRTEGHFDEIVGESTVLKTVLNQAKVVAPSDATTLILGETGTGKELVARAIHRMSSRRNGTFVKVNCAAIPTGLLESELFGHERGAFTGAVSQRVGRMELAHGGTLFLDEVGDLPLELQPKLFRVLQDQEFERLGSTKTIKVSIRVLAATNRDLSREVMDGEFRKDLYYRLNVFPIRIPPLRERSEDIPLLVYHFLRNISRRMNKNVKTIPTETMKALCNWCWPGNVRELENFMERAVILSEGSTLRAPLAELTADIQTSSFSPTLENLERQHIIRMLREAGGVISGASGAATRLGSEADNPAVENAKTRHFPDRLPELTHFLTPICRQCADMASTVTVFF
jgi:formate hydrogenlyase transcriptional activator